MRTNSFEGYLMKQYVRTEEPCTNDCSDGYDEWLVELDVELFIAYAEQYKNIAVARTIDLLGGM